MRKALLFTLILALIGVPLLTVSAQEDATIADIVQTDENFSTLADALTTAELLETLAGEGPFTVFAPNNAAFEALPPGMLDGILSSPPSREAVLLFHVVEGNLSAEDVAGMETIQTVAGIPLKVSVDADGNVVLNDTATVVTADIPAANGVIHAIDNVLVPARPGSEQAQHPPAAEEGAPQEGSITALVGETEGFEFLSTVLGLAPYAADLLGKEGAYTVFAPNDEAFLALDEDIRNAAIADNNLLTSILLYHVLVGSTDSGTLLATLDADEDKSVEFETVLPGALVTLSLDADGNLLVNEAMVVQADIEAINGAIHIINGVLIPPDDAIINVEELMGEAGETDIAEGPALDAQNWAPVMGGFNDFAPSEEFTMPELDTADDFFVTVIDPFTQEELYGVEIINWVAEYQYTSYIVEQFLPGEVLVWMGEQDPTTWENISDETLKKLPAEELAKLPAEVQARVQ
jgi:uncharacterized surface protein with fasciclin (FAS1) repeats